MHAGQLTAKQRTALVESARAQYTAKLDEAKNAAKAADDPYEKAAADFTVAHNRAIIKLLDAIPE